MLSLLLSNHLPQVVVSLVDIGIHIFVIFNTSFVLQFVLMHVLFLLTQLVNLVVDKLYLILQIL